MRINVNAALEYWQQQSPIRLEGTIHAPELEIEFRGYHQKIKGMLVETADGHGYNLKVASDTHAALRIDGVACQLTQLHFHSRSEHFIGGSDAGLEIHLIHEIPDRPDGSQYFVVGILLNPVAGGSKIKGLSGLNKLFEKRIARDGVVAPSSTDGEEFDPRGFMPSKPYRFYRYEGSLTTPPFSETISWIVMADILNVDESDVNHIVKQCTHAARELQPLNRRFVLRSFQ